MPKCLLLTGLILLSPLTTLASFEGDIIAATNKERLEASSSALIENSLLSQIAAARAARMAETEHFSHTDVDGHNAWYWIKEGGYTFTRAGENIAVNFNDASAAVAKWMNSDGHRANILNKNFVEIGVGTAQGLYKGATSTYIVQLFGTRMVDGEQDNADDERQKEIQKNTAQTASVTVPQQTSQPEKNSVTAPPPPLKLNAPLSQTEKNTSFNPVSVQEVAPQVASVSVAEPGIVTRVFRYFISILTIFW